MDKQIKQIREVFKHILDKKLERIVKAKEKESSAIHEYSIPYLHMINTVKKEKYLPQNTLNKYDKKYYKAIHYNPTGRENKIDLLCSAKWIEEQSSTKWVGKNKDEKEIFN